MKYIIYLRVSTNKQDERTQLDNCLKVLRQKEGDEPVYEVFTDIISTRKKLEKRPGIQAALKAIANGDVLVSMRMDRLSRNLHETTTIIHELEKKNADVFLIDQPGIKNKVLLGLYAGMAEEEVKMIRKRIKEKLHAKRERNERISRHVPYGYMIDPYQKIKVKNQNDGGWTLKLGLLIPEHQEKKIIDIMMNLFSQGYSYEQIARSITEQGYRNRAGQPFQKMTIYRIIARNGQDMPNYQIQSDKVAVASH